MTSTPRSFLENLDPQARELLLSVSQPVSFLKGAVLVRQSEAARGAFVLRAGEVEATVTLPGGERLTVARLGPGGIFGEMALVERGTVTATVAAVAPVDGWFIGHEEFRALAAQRSAGAIAIQHAVTEVISAKLRALNARVLECPAPEDPPLRAWPAGEALAGIARRRGADSLAAFLPRLAVFERFSADEIDEVVAHARVLELPRGHAVFVPGERARAAFIVARGAVEVSARCGEREKRLAVLGPGQLLGQMSALEDSAHTAFAVAREAATLLELPCAAFRALYFATTPAGARLRHAVQQSLLAAIGRTNHVLSRLISAAKLGRKAGESADLEAAYHAGLMGCESRK